ncbi:MAG: ribose-5-phosphate isomerase RpiA [Candidatus Caldarchaeum sp.]|nr:ribose-5-phosphate isomerase RpiA [Candidatus Caldarchaeum sp.]MCS7138070.1 ribose-5-phosphate isomerase RpiA [Candidatus Caldarchaeum sp.]MDW8359646.1 ribose-5-phosphate isomerase RpiA [Candidatus Caldarchaeum sp.]
MNDKREAARAAAAYVEEGMVVGLGSGSTVSLMIAEIAGKAKNITVIPASSQTYLECVNAGLTLTTLDRHPQPDIYLDSFDQVDRARNMIKGGGAALMREKVLATASRKRIFAGTYSKVVDRLNRPVPLEVLPFALGYVVSLLREKQASPRLRDSDAKNGPTVTDNGNYILDVDFGEIEEPSVLEAWLRKVPGVLENGLFVGLADRVLIAYGGGFVEEL